MGKEQLADLVRFNSKPRMKNPAKEFKKNVGCDILEILWFRRIWSDGCSDCQTSYYSVCREAERETSDEELKKTEGEIISGTVQRRDRNGVVIVD